MFFRLMRKNLNLCQRICSPKRFVSKVPVLSTVPQSNTLETLPTEICGKGDVPNPLNHEDFFCVHELFTMKDLFDARVHLGHTMGTLNKHMNEFIIGHRLGTLIFDLDQTAELLKNALNFAAHIAFREGIILFVSRYKQHTYLIEKTAMECKEFSHTRFWYQGMFSDPKRYGMMTRLPDLVIILNTLDAVFENHQSVLESNKLLIPTIGIVDSNAFPNYITYPVPGNDDSLESIKLYLKLFKQAILRGKSKREEFIQKYGPDYYMNFEE